MDRQNWKKILINSWNSFFLFWRIFKLVFEKENRQYMISNGRLSEQQLKAEIIYRKLDAKRP